MTLITSVQKFLTGFQIGAATGWDFFFIFVFLGIILLFYFLMPRSILGSALRIRKRGDASWPQLSILGLFQIGLFAAILLSFLPAKAITDFSPLVKKIFIGPEAQFVWVTLPILAMVLMRKKRTEE